ncbi:MAG: serine hydrolase domain-containing protein [Chryseobacterium jejuense]|uniref:serine hydrolase domain-containing protein n=1 Tax=Chryseobacterium jejuense TaxID=445960 RepID=UPI003D120575
MKNKILFLALFIVIGIQAQSVDKVRIDSLFNTIENNQQDLGAVSIFKNGKEVYKRTFGEIDIAALKKTPNLKYNMGSVSKMVTASLIFKLMDQKKLNLDDKLSLFFPEIPNAKNITIQNLLGHTSGLQNFIIKKEDGSNWLINGEVSEKNILNEIIEQNIAFQPNEKVLYSNSAYYLLSKIIEKVHHSEYAKVLEQEIIKPLKLKDFASFHNVNYKDIIPSYQYDNGWKPVKDFYFGNVVGVGDIAATAFDMNVFIQNLFAGRIVSLKSLRQMLPKQDRFFGNGLINSSFGGNSLFGHHGDTYGSHSIVLYNPENNMAISLVLNGERMSKDDVVYALLQIIFKNKKSIKDRQIDEISSKLIEGSYISSDLPMTFKISTENQFLKAEVDDQPAFLLDRIGKNRFEFFAAGIVLEFDPVRKSMKLVQRGQEYGFLKK